MATPFTIIARGPFQRGQVVCEYLPALALTRDVQVDRAIERAWRRTKRRARLTGIPMYSGRLVRVAGHEVARGRLRLEVGPTTYREYVGTRAPNFSQGRPRDALANPLAVCALIRTADGGIVVGRRAGVDIASGQYAFPGGFVERGKDADPFAAIAREVHEELGLDILPDAFVCLGLIYALPHPHYELCFAARTDLSFAAITRLTPMEKEASNLERLADDPVSLAEFRASSQGSMSPSGEACLTLYLGE